MNQNNVMVANQYYDEYSRDSLDHVRSVTKTVMSTLIGIAIDKGIISGVDASIGKYLGNTALDKRNITIKHLLTMTSGISWNEGANAAGYNAWATSPNELEYVLNKPMAEAPGTVWNYNSGAIHILSAVLTEASGMSTLTFANKYLFDPLRIENIRWEKRKDGYYNGAAGLELKPRDMIRFGQLFAQGGIFNGQRIISEAYIKEATSHHQPEDMDLDEDSGYGYCWWLIEFKGNRIFAALGYAGQTIAVAPKLKTVMVLTYNWRVSGSQASQQQEQSTNTLIREAFEGMLGK